MAPGTLPTLSIQRPEGTSGSVLESLPSSAKRVYLPQGHDKNSNSCRSAVNAQYAMHQSAMSLMAIRAMHTSHDLFRACLYQVLADDQNVIFSSTLRHYETTIAGSTKEGTDYWPLCLCRMHLMLVMRRCCCFFHPTISPAKKCQCSVMYCEYRLGTFGEYA